MKQINELTIEEETTLSEAYRHHPIFRVRQRAHALLLNRRGYSMTKLKDFFEVQLETVSRWLTRWESEGIVGLFDGERSGRPVLLDGDDMEILKKAIDENPHQLKMAHEQLVSETGKAVSRHTVKRALKKKRIATSVAANLAATNVTKHSSSKISK